MADVTLQHLLLADFLAFVLLRAVIVILMDHGIAAVVAQLRSGHRRALQITAQVFHAAPGAAILRMQITVPPIFITDMTAARQATWVDLGVVVAQQVNHGVTPDFLDLFLFKEQLPPGAVFDDEAAAGDGDMDMRGLIELPAVGMERAEDTDFDTLLACPAEHGAGGAAKQFIKQRPVVVEERPQQMRHGEGDVLPVAVGQDVLLFGNPLLGGLEATAAAGFGFAALAEEAGVGTVRRGAAVAAYTHGTGAAGEHAFDGEFGPVAEGIAVFVEIAAPAAIMLEQQFCGARNIHGAEFTGWQRAGKGRRCQPAQSTGVLILCGCQRAVGHVPPRGS